MQCKTPTLLFTWILSILLHAQSVGLANPPAEHTPRRIIAIGPNSAEVICALGACDSIVGVSKFCVYPPELQSRPKIGGLFDADLEHITALQPDLIVTRGHHDALETLAANAGIALYHDRTDSLSGIETCIHDLGQVLSRKERAVQLVAEFRGRIDSIRVRFADRPRPRLLVTLMRQPDRLADLLTAGKGTFVDEMIEIAGGSNVFGDMDMRYPQVSMESIIARQPEVIVELVPEIRLTDDLEKRMRDQWRQLGTIPAVAEDRIYFLQDDHSLIPSPRVTLIIEKLARILHPEEIATPP